MANFVDTQVLIHFCQTEMNTLSSLGSSHFLPQKMSEVLAALNAGSSHLSPLPSSSSIAQAGATNDDIVSLSDAGVALAKRASDLGNATVDAAQSLVSSFAQQLFGDAAQGMKISFDSASISAMAGFSAAVQHSNSADGSSDAAALRVQESADFVGKGEITTADGHRYNFEVEVHYQAMAQTSVATRTVNAPAPDQGATSAAALPSTVSPSALASAQGLKAHFPGSVADLFKMLDQGQLNLLFQLPSQAEGGDAGKGQAQHGHLTLRLLELIDSPQANSKKLAQAYGLPADSKENTAGPVRNDRPLPVLNATVAPANTALEPVRSGSAASA